MERFYMKLELLKGETLSKLNEHFRRKVQLEEELKENEVQLQFGRGMMDAIDKSQRMIRESQQADKIEDLKAKKSELSRVSGSDGVVKDRSEVKVNE